MLSNMQFFILNIVHKHEGHPINWSYSPDFFWTSEKHFVLAVKVLDELTVYHDQVSC